MWFIYPLYVVLLCFVVFLSGKLADLVDLLDKKNQNQRCFLRRSPVSRSDVFTGILYCHLSSHDS